MNECEDCIEPNQRKEKSMGIEQGMAQDILII